MAVGILRAQAEVEHSQVSGVEEEYFTVAQSPSTMGSLWHRNSHPLVGVQRRGCCKQQLDEQPEK